LFLLAMVQPMLAQTGDKKKDKDTEPPKKEEMTESTKVNGKVLDEWIKLIDNPDRSKTEMAIQAIVSYPPEVAKKAVPTLLKELQKHKPAFNESIDMSVRVNGCIAIGMILGSVKEPDKQQLADAVKVLRAMLKDDQVIVKFRAAQAAAQLGPRAHETIPELAKLVQDPSTWETRNAAAIALGIVALEPPPAKDKEPKKDIKDVKDPKKVVKDKDADPPKDNKDRVLATTALYTRLQHNLKGQIQEKCLKVRLSALQALDNLGVAFIGDVNEKQKFFDNVDHAAKKDPDPLMRLRASFMVWPLLTEKEKKGKISDPKGFTTFFKHEDPSIRLEAAHLAMAYFDKEPQFKMPLLNDLANYDKDFVLRVKVHMMLYGALKEKKDEKEKKDRRDELSRILIIGDVAGRVEAAVALGSLGEEACDQVFSLTRALDDKEWHVVGFAIAALIHTGKCAAPALSKLEQLYKNDKAPTEIRDTAADAIDQIRAKLDKGGGK
jgi:HEAT repeat protein